MNNIKIFVSKFLHKVLNFFAAFISQELRSKKQSYHFSRGIIINKADINLIFDVGANSGQYATLLRKVGYCGDIISIEPLLSAFKKMENIFKDDSNWTGYNFAAGNDIGTLEINVSEDSVCSSLLLPSEKFLSAIPTARIIETQSVDVLPIDTLCEDLNIDLTQKNILLKIDVQGFENQVLQGAQKLLENVKIVEIELSLQEGYSEAFMVDDAINFFKKHGFELISIDRGYCNPNSGEVLDADFLFQKIS